MSTIAEIEPRTYFSRLDNALADFGPPVEAIDRIREVVRDLDFTHVYIPESRAYVALEPDDGGEAIAYIFPAFIALHPRDAVSTFVELPHPAEVEPEPSAPGPATAATRGAKPAAASSPVAACARCYVTLPASGACDYCD